MSCFALALPSCSLRPAPGATNSVNLMRYPHDSSHRDCRRRRRRLELATRTGKSTGKRKQAEITTVDANLTHIWKPLLHEVAAGSLNSSEDELNYVARAKWNHFNFQLGRMSGFGP